MIQGLRAWSNGSRGGAGQIGSAPVSDLACRCCLLSAVIAAAVADTAGALDREMACALWHPPECSRHVATEGTSTGEHRMMWRGAGYVDKKENITHTKRTLDSKSWSQLSPRCLVSEGHGDAADHSWSPPLPSPSLPLHNDSSPVYYHDISQLQPISIIPSPVPRLVLSAEFALSRPKCRAHQFRYFKPP